MSQWYITRLWRTSRTLFAVLAIFCAIQIFFTVKRIHNFPFFIYDMYSRPAQQPEKISVPVLYVNDTLRNYTRLPNWKEGAILNLGKFYIGTKDKVSQPERVFKQRFGDRLPSVGPKIYPDSAAYQAFPAWYAGYLSICFNTEVYSYKLGYREFAVDNNNIQRQYHETIRMDWR
jgi:hypothetical protein